MAEPADVRSRLFGHLPLLLGLRRMRRRLHHKRQPPQPAPSPDTLISPLVPDARTSFGTCENPLPGGLWVPDQAARAPLSGAHRFRRGRDLALGLLAGGRTLDADQ
jgi:hypothetical protein